MTRRNLRGVAECTLGYRLRVQFIMVGQQGGMADRVAGCGQLRCLISHLWNREQRECNVPQASSFFFPPFYSFMDLTHGKEPPQAAVTETPHHMPSLDLCFLVKPSE